MALVQVWTCCPGALEEHLSPPASAPLPGLWLLSAPSGTRQLTALGDVNVWVWHSWITVLHLKNQDVDFLS